VAIEHNLYKNIRDIYMYTDFEMLKVKVPNNFFGMEGFSACSDRRYNPAVFPNLNPDLL
jgi:hypothetical protein